MVSLLLMYPATLLAVDVPFDTTPEGFQGQSDLVNVLNKIQMALLIILVIVFIIVVFKLATAWRSGDGMKQEAIGVGLTVFAFIVVSNPAYWIDLISSWLGQ